VVVVVFLLLPLKQAATVTSALGSTLMVHNKKN